MWIWRFWATTMPGRLGPPIGIAFMGTAASTRFALSPNRNCRVHSPFSASRIETLGAPKSRALVSAICFNARSASLGAGDGAQDFGTGALAISRNAQFALQPRVLLRGRGLLGDRCIMRGKTGFESVLQLGNVLVEIGQHVRGKRGHSLNPLHPTHGGRGLEDKQPIRASMVDYSITGAPEPSQFRPFSGRMRKNANPGWFALRSPALKPRFPCW